jgi:hypothetical protein
MASCSLNLALVKDWPSFHAESVRAFGFPQFYGHNMDAWIDCLSYLADGDGMSAFHLGEDEMLTVALLGFERFSQEHSDICSAFLECIACANGRYTVAGGIARIAVVPQ